MSSNNIFVRWEKPRRFAVRVYVPRKGIGGFHYSVGVVSESVDQAVAAAQTLYPTGCIQSVNDTGAVDLVVSFPEITNEQTRVT